MELPRVKARSQDISLVRRSCPHLLAYSDFATVDAPLAVVVLMVTPFMYHFWHIVVGTLCGHKKCVAHFMHGGAGWRSS
jgi:hypothetical protein